MNDEAKAAADEIRAKVSELNALIDAGTDLGLRVAFDTMERHQVGQKTTMLSVDVTLSI